jgi:hypothetical protein
LEYNPVTEACCGSGKYTIATQFCSDTDVLGKCGGENYNPDTQFCLGDVATPLCGGEKFTSSQFCSGGAVYSKCGGTVTFTPGTENCCGSVKYILATHYCRTSDNTTHTCGNLPYNPATHTCHTDNVAYSCNNKPLNPDTQFCYGDSKIGEYCGGREETFDPDLYKCVDDSKIYLKTPVSYEGEEYEAVLIGTQTWLARNLNYDVPDNTTDVCYSNQPARCVTYGRLYNWETAMALSICNSASCADQIRSPHQGICPDGWHLPSKCGVDCSHDFCRHWPWNQAEGG